MAAVSGGKGSPRFGCRKSWQEGLSACTNRLTIRIKVAEPQILAKLQQELLDPATLAYITKAVEKELKKSAETSPKQAGSVRKRLEQERRKLQNLVSALEGGSDAPASILKAINEREKTVAQLEGELAAADQPRPQEKPRDMSQFVHTQLSDLHALLKTDPAKVKTEFRRLNLALTFHPTEAKPRPYYMVKGQCDLSALAFSFFYPAERGSLIRAWKPRLQGASLDSLGEHPVHSRTRFLLKFFREAAVRDGHGQVERAWENTPA
jgi:hypothetical protein